MALKGKIYSIAKQYDDLNTNKIFESMMIESTDKNSIVLDGRNIGAGSIFAEQIHANAITADHIKSGAIETDHMDAGTIDVDRLKAGQLILPGINYGGVVIDNSGISMKPTEESRLDVKLSSKSGFNITDGNNQLIDIDPKTGNVIMQVNKMTIGGHSAATAEDIEKRPTFEDFEKTDKVTIDGGNIKAGTISSENNYSWIDLDKGFFSFGDGRLVWNGSEMTVDGKIEVKNIDGDIPKDKLESSVRTEIDAGTAAKTKTDAWSFNGTTKINGTSIETGTLSANVIKTGVLEDLNKNTRFDLTNGTFNIGDKFTYNGSTLSVNADNINLSGKVAFSDFSQGLKDTVDSKVTQSDVDSSINNLEVGGRNYIRNSSFHSAKSLWGTNGSTSTLVDDSSSPSGTAHKSTSASHGIYVGYGNWAKGLEVSDTVTLSVVAKRNGSSGHLRFGEERHVVKTVTLTDSYEKYTHTYTNNNATLIFYGPATIHSIKLEKGNKATDWTPAPEDTDKRLDEVEGNINNAVTTIDNTGVTVKDGSFFLEDDTSDTKYSLQVKRNMIDYHSFETVHAFPPEYNDLTSSTVNPDNTSNTSIGGSWNRVGSPRITRGGATYQNEKVGIFGKSIVANNSNYIFLMLSSSQAELFPGERLTFSFHSKAPILGTGGIPRVEVHMVRANNTVVTTIGTKNYPASTKAIKRHSFSFTIPSNFDDNSHLLRIRVLSSNSNEVVIDGTQLVEGNHPVQYDLATEAWNLREELGMNSQNLRGDINYRGISPGLIHTNQISVPNNSDSRVINFMQSDGISTHMWVDEAVVRRSLDVYGNINISENPIIDSGHNTNGEWMKFYDGTMICRGYRAKTMALNSSWGSMYWGNIGVMTYPKEFVEIPYVTYTSSSESALFVATIANRSTSKTGNVDIYRPVSTVSQRWEIGYIAIGRWKW